MPQSRDKAIKERFIVKARLYNTLPAVSCLVLPSKVIIDLAAVNHHNGHRSIVVALPVLKPSLHSFQRNDNRMSALQQSAIVRRSLQALRRVSEQEAIMTVGRLALTAADAASGLEALASVALRLSGLHGVEVRLQTAGQELVDVLEWHGSKEAAPRGAATGLIAANGREWGRMRILFEPRVRSLECPLRFVRILGQQVALMFNRLAVVTGNQTAKAAIRRLEQRLDMRKAVTRAAGILARVKKPNSSARAYASAQPGTGSAKIAVRVGADDDLERGDGALGANLVTVGRRVSSRRNLRRGGTPSSPAQHRMR